MGTDERQRIRIAVIGAGFGGIGTAIRLRQRGETDFLVFDRGTEVGGTWRDNSYPGCACDVPSHMYSLSFAPNPDWTRSFSGQPEIFAYLRHCVDTYGIRPHLRLGHEVLAATWDPAGGWLIDTSQGDYRADILVAAGGPLSEPSVPDLSGLDTFAGETFHSARWRHDLDLADRQVAVIGTGASAIQFVPQIAPTVDRLRLFQRTPPWVLPRADHPISPLRRALFRRIPLLRRVARAGVYWVREAMGTGFLRPALMRVTQQVARLHLRRAIPDPALRAKLMPQYRLGCKRVLLSDDYYPALARPHVEVVTDRIERITPTGVLTVDGTLHPADTIIFGTGFHVTDPPVAARITGRYGHTLADAWKDTMSAHLGTTVHGFPNLFLLLGPNTGLGHNSVVFMLECQLHHVLGALDHLNRTGETAVEPTIEAQREFVARVDRRMAGTVWSTGGCRSWYLDPSGRNSTLWPGYSWSYWLRTRRFDPHAYQPVEVSPTSPVTLGVKE